MYNVNLGVKSWPILLDKESFVTVKLYIYQNSVRLLLEFFFFMLYKKCYKIGCPYNRLCSENKRRHKYKIYNSNTKMKIIFQALNRVLGKILSHNFVSLVHLFPLAQTNIV